MKILAIATIITGSWRGRRLRLEACFGKRVEETQGINRMKRLIYVIAICYGADLANHHKYQTWAEV